MKVLKCSQCAANLPPGEPGDTVVCTFCGAAILIPRPEPPRVEIHRIIDKPREPVSGDRSGFSCLPVLLVSLALPILGMTLASTCERIFGFEEDDSPATGLGSLLRSDVPWESSGVILARVNGDATPDVIGRLRRVSPDDTVWLAALDGATGERLWETPSLGTYMETYQGALARVGSRLVLGTEDGTLRSWDLRTGAPGWSASTPDVVERFCVSPEGDGTLSAELKTGRLLAIDAATGAIRGTTMASCAPADSEAGQLPDVFVELPESFNMRRTGVLETHQATYVIGSRDSGTAVPMIASLHADPSLNWVSDLPATRPLASRLARMNPYAAANSTAVFTVYEREEAHHYVVVAFDHGGRRQWEFEVPEDSPLESIAASEDFVYVAQWNHLTAIRAKTGEVAWK
jgi:outer membrane protein assembly factor BamB